MEPFLSLSPTIQVRRIFMGSVSQAVVTQGDIPVLLVK